MYLNSNIEIHKLKLMILKDIELLIYLNSNIEIHKFHFQVFLFFLQFYLNSNIEIHK